MLKQLWNDDAGIVTLEYLVLGTILALGVIVGVTLVTAALNVELGEFAAAITGLDQDYSSTGFDGFLPENNGGGNSANGEGGGRGTLAAFKHGSGTIANRRGTIGDIPADATVQYNGVQNPVDINITP